MITDYPFSFLAVAFIVICLFMLAMSALLYWAAAKMQSRRETEGQHIGHFCRECDDFESRVHKGYCYYREIQCKAYNNACPFFKSRNGATEVRR